MQYEMFYFIYAKRPWKSHSHIHFNMCTHFDNVTSCVLPFVCVLKIMETIKKKPPDQLISRLACVFLISLQFILPLCI